MVAEAGVEWAIQMLSGIHLLEMPAKSFRFQFAVKIVSQGEDTRQWLIQFLSERRHLFCDGGLVGVSGAEVPECQQMHAVVAEPRCRRGSANGGSPIGGHQACAEKDGPANRLAT